MEMIVGLLYACSICIYNLLTWNKNNLTEAFDNKQYEIYFNTKAKKQLSVRERSFLNYGKT